MPLNKEQLNQIRDERKDQIMTAALKVFAVRGIVGTTISMIAAEAGVSQGLFYHYFKSKDEAFITLVQEAMELSYTAIENLHSMQVSPLEKIRVLTSGMLNEEGKPSFMLIYQARMSDSVPAQVKELFSQYSMKTYVNLLMPIFAAGQKSGEIAEGDLEKLIADYLSVLSGLMVVNAQESGEYRIPDVDTVIRLVSK